MESDVQKVSTVQSKQISEDESAKIRSELEIMETRLNTALSQKEALELELERRAIQGDYNPTDTKVLHFRNNPLQQATEEHSLRLSKLQGDNESLKTRIKLLEEGQSKDLTLLVGQKMEENVSSQEVQELKEQLKSKDIQKQRLLEAFSNTSKSFREVCCQLTGYRIDGLQNNQFRLTPTYAENPTDENLLFRLEQGGELSMLDTPFSSQLTELIDLHLIRQNSIPVFLAAVIMDLFSRQTFETFQESQSETAPSQGPSNYPAQMDSVAVLPGPSGFQQENDQNQPEIQYQSEEDGESSVGQEEMSEGEVGEEEGMEEESIDNEEELDDDQDEVEEEEDDDDDPVICLD